MARDADATRLSPTLRRVRDIRAVEACVALDERSGGARWSEKQWLQSLEFDDCWLYSDADQHVAAAVLQPAVEDIALLNLLVDRERQRRGIARWMLGQLLAEYRRANFRRCLLEVRISNLPAQQLYRQLGFASDGIRKNYYPADGGHEDALLMSLNLQGSPQDAF